MVDLTEAAAATVRDPLVVTLFIFSLGGLLTHFLYCRHPLSRALARRQAAGQLIASVGIDKSVPPRRVAAWFSDRLHRLFDLAKAE